MGLTFILCSRSRLISTNVVTIMPQMSANEFLGTLGRQAAQSLSEVRKCNQIVHEPGALDVSVPL